MNGWTSERTDEPMVCRSIVWFLIDDDVKVSATATEPIRSQTFTIYMLAHKYVKRTIPHSLPYYNCNYIEHWAECARSCLCVCVSRDSCHRTSH